MRKNLISGVVLLGLVAVAACAEAGPQESSMPTSTTLRTTTTPAPASTTTTPASTTTTTTLPPTTATTTTATPADPEVVIVPAVRAAVIDGVLEPSEWDGASSFPMSDGAAVRLMYEDETLYVAVEGDELGAVNVVMAADDEIWILHSSAALGSALYEPGSGEWLLTHGFNWCCRDRSDESRRLALLEEEGWQANIGFTGDPGTVEYQIAIPWHGASIAVSSIRDDDDTGFWPADLSAEARDQLLGVPPATRLFDSAEWYVLTTNS
jgi:hypothetical protein